MDSFVREGEGGIVRSSFWLFKRGERREGEDRTIFEHVFSTWISRGNNFTFNEIETRIRLNLIDR